MRFASLMIGFLGLASVGISSSALAQTDQDRARAREEFGRGVELFEAEDYREALAAFQEAYRLAPHPSVRVNMANCYEQLHQPLEAMFHYERFLAEAEQVSAAQRNEVRSALEQLRRQTGEVTFRIAPDGASVTLDGAETRRAPIQAPVRMAEGNHTVEVRLDGYEPFSREFVVAGGSPAEVTVRLTRATAETTPPVATTPPVETDTQAGENAESLGEAEDATGSPQGEGSLVEEAHVDLTPTSSGLRLTTPVIVSGAVTGALLVGAVITGVLALGADSDFDDAVRDSNNAALSPADREAARRDGLDALDRADSLALVTDILLVGTLIGAGATTFFLLTADDGGERMAQSPRVAPTAGSHGGGVVLSGTF